MFFANERTFISWLHMAVIIASISTGVLAFTGDGSKDTFLSLCGQFAHMFACCFHVAAQSHFMAVLMLPLALCFVVYAVWTYLWRSERINTRDVER